MFFVSIFYTVRVPVLQGSLRSRCHVRRDNGEIPAFGLEWVQATWVVERQEKMPQEN
jgi:hypothetical protein